MIESLQGHDYDNFGESLIQADDIIEINQSLLPISFNLCQYSFNF